MSLCDFPHLKSPMLAAFVLLVDQYSHNANLTLRRSGEAATMNGSH